MPIDGRLDKRNCITCHKVWRNQEQEEVLKQWRKAGDENLPSYGIKVRNGSVAFRKKQGHYLWQGFCACHQAHFASPNPIG